MTRQGNDTPILFKGFLFLIANIVAVAATALMFSSSSASTTTNASPIAPETSINTDIPWPPFWFDLIPSYEDGRITYRVDLFSRIDQQMFDLAIKIPIPEGTRFLEASALPETAVEFDGQEVTFFTAVLDKFIEGASFTVEITDPTQTAFATQGWITWKGQIPGDYLAEVVSFDITRQPLNWNDTTHSRLQLGIGATVADDIITYTIYPKAVIGQGYLWDLKINIPLPEGTTLLLVDAPPPFATSFDGWEISFFTLELERQDEVGPLTFKVSTEGVADSMVMIPVWAAWKNGETGTIPGAPVQTSKKRIGFEGEGPTAPAEEQIMLDTVVTQPHISQQIVFDMSGDVPFSNYDLISIAFRENGTMLTVVFNTAGDVGPVGQPVAYTLFIDSDCNSNTGQRRENRGADYRVNYNHEMGRASIIPWDVAQEDWRWAQVTGLNSLVDGKAIMISVPHNLMGAGEQFCWVGWTSNGTKAFNTDPPRDWIPNEEFFKLTQYEIMTTTTGIRGRLAIPLYNEQGFYKVHIFSLPDGEELDQITNAHQPNFRFDGQRLLTNHESSGVENVYQYDLADGRTGIFVFKNYGSLGNIYEYNLADETENQVSDEAQNSHPFYDPTGSRVVYGSSGLTIDTVGSQPAYISVQCSLLPAHQEVEPRCQNLSRFGVLVSAGQAGEIWGNYPVWTSNDMIAYKGCDNWAEATSCGIYMVGSWATKGLSNGAMPIQLTQDGSDIPSDTKGNLIAFTSQRDGNWEAYVMSLDGTKVRNLSKNLNSNDGLPTISPDGNWVAFVSDRGGRWAVWLVPVTGGPVQKLFNLPTDIPWGNNDPTWLDERISWGP